MKARTFILTTSVCFALIVPAAQAANTQNRLFQTKVQTVLWDKSHRASDKTLAGVTHGKKAPTVANNPKQSPREAPRPPSPAASTGEPVVEEFFCIDDSNAAEYGRSAPIEESLSNASPATAPTDSSKNESSVNESTQDALAPVLDGSSYLDYWQDRF
jgi:hypothetical protein